MTDTAIRATFSGLRPISTRKVAQLIFEIPSEAVDNALRVLGGWPQPDSERWVAIAPISLDAPIEPEKPKREFTLSQRAGMMCQDAQFTTFIRSRADYNFQSGVDDAVTKYVRRYCGVESRSELNTDIIAAKAWCELLTEFDAWRGKIGRP